MCTVPRGRRGLQCRCTEAVEGVALPFEPSRTGRGRTRKEEATVQNGRQRRRRSIDGQLLGRPAARAVGMGSSRGCTAVTRQALAGTLRDRCGHSRSRPASRRKQISRPRAPRRPERLLVCQCSSCGPAHRPHDPHSARFDCCSRQKLCSGTIDSSSSAGRCHRPSQWPWTDSTRTPGTGAAARAAGKPASPVRRAPGAATARTQRPTAAVPAVQALRAELGQIVAPLCPAHGPAALSATQRRRLPVQPPSATARRHRSHTH